MIDTVLNRLFDASPSGVHTFEVRVLGTKNLAAKDCFIDLDRLIVSNDSGKTVESAAH
jgi:hypothetical protein